MPSSAQMVGAYKSPIQFISGFTGSGLSAGVTSVTISGHQVGDFLLARGGNAAQSTDPTFTAGWTKICSYNCTAAGSLRVGILVYKYATTTANETVTFTGASATAAAAYSAGYVFRYVRGIGNFNTVTGVTTSASSVPTPSLTLSDTTTGISTLVLASFVGAMIGAPNSMTVTNGMAYGQLRSSWAGGNMTLSASFPVNCGIVELLN